MAKRKPKPKSSALKSRTKTLTSSDGEKFKSFQSKRKFDRSIVQKRKTKNADKLGKDFDAKIRPAIEKFFRSNKRKGNKYLFRIDLSHNLKGKRLKGGFSARRRKITSEKSLQRAIGEYRQKFLLSLEQYLKRKDLSSITIRGIKMEVVIDEPKSRTHNRKRKKA